MNGRCDSSVILLDKMDFIITQKEAPVTQLEIEVENIGDKRKLLSRFPFFSKYHLLKRHQKVFTLGKRLIFNNTTLL